jgi:dynein heavy chain
MLIFIDDLNMPKKEEYGSQPPIEILRQLQDNGGWYDRSERTWKNIIDTTLIGAMGPPGGGKEFITPRLLRHFNLITFTELSDDSMNTIFFTILN